MHEQDRVFAKCAWRLIPFMMLLYLASYIDRVNVAFAALTMNKDLGFTPVVYGFGAGIFTFGYSIFQIPSNVILERVGARRWIFCIMTVWALLSTSTAFVQGPMSFYVLRFLLGCAEAGFFPGMIFYLTLWFPKEYRTRYTAAFQTGIPLAIIVGGPLSGLILGLEGQGGLRGWQWLFLLEGLPVLILAFVVLKLLPNGPQSAPFLSPGEKDTIRSRLSAEQAGKNNDLWTALCDLRVIALGLVLVGNTTALYGVQLWLPQIVQAMGFSNLATGIVVAIPFAAAVPVMILWGRSSDVKGERIWHVAWPILTTGAGLVLASMASDYRLALLGLAFAAIGPIVAAPPLNNLPATFLGGAAAAGGIALYNSIGNLGGFIGPFVIGEIKEHTGGYAWAMAAIALGSAISATIVLAVGRAMALRVARPQAAE